MTIKGLAGRKERLAAALKENLKRRKAQARTRRGADASCPTPKVKSGTETCGSFAEETPPPGLKAAAKPN